ncbi:MAG: DUF3429 domain-containing protein [Acetobacteraceae bacterium]|nr:DUF3429 domain-containing protein [Acetobacteraceae bacterium]MBV8525908.1 DUF3429 domain-containing protein [Acetobacteraceae bacterium]
MPVVAVVLGVLGLIPVVICGLASLSAVAGREGPGFVAFITYSAAILAFLGGVHWGFALAPRTPVAADSRIERSRLVFGVLPMLAAWFSLMLAWLAHAWAGLAILIVSFIGAVVIETRASQRGLVPRGYIILRWVLTVVVLAMLITVLTLRLLQQRVLIW